MLFAMGGFGIGAIVALVIAGLLGCAVLIAGREDWGSHLMGGIAIIFLFVSGALGYIEKATSLKHKPPAITAPGKGVEKR